MKVCNRGYALQENGRPPIRCHLDDQPEFCKDCVGLSDVFTREEVLEAIDNLKDWDNYSLFHKAVDRVIYMFENMEEYEE